MCRVTHNQDNQDSGDSGDEQGTPGRQGPDAVPQGPLSGQADTQGAQGLQDAQGVQGTQDRTEPVADLPTVGAPPAAARGQFASAERLFVPAWQRVTRGEPRWASTIAVAAVMVIQVALPPRLGVHPRLLMPLIEAALLIGLIIINPTRIERGTSAYRALGLVLALTIGGANMYSAVRLVTGLVRGTEGHTAAALLLNGGAIWLTNVVIFALAYWELDRGGPAARANAERDVPDFLFVQMQSPELAPPHWEPAFFDYFYLSFTNSTAFSPTDVMPITRTAKALMFFESMVSLMMVVLVVARAVNILN